MKPEYYARALHRLIEKGLKPSEAVRSLKEVLEKQGRLALAPSIARAFARLAETSARRSSATLFVAHKKDEARARKESGTKDAEVVHDENLIGGWRLEAGEMLEDASWKHHLLTIYQNTIRS